MFAYHCIDFGLSHDLKPKNETLRIRSGTLDFITNYAHEYTVRSLAQDLGSLAYMAIYFLKGGTLPWSKKTQDSNEERLKFVFESKKSLTPTVRSIGHKLVTRLLQPNKMLE